MRALFISEIKLIIIHSRFARMQNVRYILSITSINSFILNLFFSEDLMMLDELVDENVETMDIDKSVLKVGCLFACLLQKKEVVRFRKTILIIIYINCIFE